MPEKPYRYAREALLSLSTSRKDLGDDAATIHSSELLHKTQLEAVERIRHTLFQSIDLDELVETTLRIALEEVGAEAGSILLADHEKEQLTFQYSMYLANDGWTIQAQINADPS
jgi:hypothetical protein